MVIQGAVGIEFAPFSFQESQGFRNITGGQLDKHKPVAKKSRLPVVYDMPSDVFVGCLEMPVLYHTHYGFSLGCAGLFDGFP